MATDTDPNSLLDWGSDAPAKKTTPLDEFIVFITDPAVNPAEDKNIKNVLVY